jgi:hypothetical protein
MDIGTCRRLFGLSLGVLLILVAGPAGPGRALASASAGNGGERNSADANGQTHFQRDGQSSTQIGNSYQQQASPSSSNQTGGHNSTGPVNINGQSGSISSEKIGQIGNSDNSQSSTSSSDASGAKDSFSEADLYGVRPPSKKLRRKRNCNAKI